MDALLQSKHGPERWTPALSNKWGCLAQGNSTGVIETNTIIFVSFDDVPSNHKVTHASFACDYCPLKDEKWRVRIVIEGDKLIFDSDNGFPAANLLENFLFNSVISDALRGAQFASMDLENMFSKHQCLYQNI